METCKKILREATEKGEHKTRLQLFTKVDDEFHPTGEHRVKLVSSRVVVGSDFETKVKRDEVEITVEKEGLSKTYNFPVRNKKGGIHYLVEKFAELKKGTEVILSGKKDDGASYIDVSVVGGRDDALEQNPKEIPIIEEDEITIEDSAGGKDAFDITKKDKIPF